jgi:4-hydroxybenzoate polyprenyltransferase
VTSIQQTVARPLPRARRAFPLAPALAAARPRQWVKNLLLFAGLLFADRLADGTAWLQALTALCAFCAASSAAYLVNDVRDAEADRLHPVKRFRPVASGALAPRTALALAAALAASALALGVALDPLFVAFLAGFGAIQAAYTLGLKRLLYADVLAIAGLFVLRAAAGAEAIGVRISPWLLACTALLALFLGLAKRRAELLLVASGRAPGRAVLARYSLATVERLLVATAAAIGVVYTAYALTGRYGPAMGATVPFVAFGLCRYLYLARTRGAGEEPEHVLLHDLPTALCVVAWALTAVGAVVL